MSYNIDSSQILTGSLTLDAADVRRFYKAHKEDLPEGNFLVDMLDEAMDAEPGVRLAIPASIDWYGEFSGDAYDTLKELLALTKGQAAIRFIWEGGDSESALKVSDGKVRDAKVKVTIE